MVDINSVKAAFAKLKEINWLYGNLDQNESLDDVSKKVVEVANSATSTMIEEATDEDIVGFQSYTIRDMNSKLSNDSDIAQYKLNSVREDPLDNRQLHLDVMCFPTLFPTGRFGEHHYRKVKEAIKALVRSLWPSKKQTCAVAAPTGLAAYNLGGVTAHRLFQLPIEHEGKPANYWSLSKASHKVMKTALQELIIDEVSMVSSLNLKFSNAYIFSLLLHIAFNITNTISDIVKYLFWINTLLQLCSNISAMALRHF